MNLKNFDPSLITASVRGDEVLYKYFIFPIVHKHSRKVSYVCRGKQVDASAQKILFDANIGTMYVYTSRACFSFLWKDLSLLPFTTALPFEGMSR